MRGLSAFAFSILVSATATAAVAQQALPRSSAAAGFAPAPNFFPRTTGEPAPGGDFDAPLYGGAALDPIDRTGRANNLIARGMVNYRDREVWLQAADGAVGRLRYASGARAADPLSVLRPDTAAHLDAFDISYTRGWPGAVRVNAGEYALDVTPHAGVGLTDQGGSAEAGATVRLGADLDDALSRFVKDGSSFGDRPRWYLFAAASGRAVGYNFLNEGGSWSGSGVSTDEGSFIGDAQAGLAWRKGDVQASFGYVHREIKAYDEKAEEGVVAFQLSIKPDW